MTINYIHNNGDVYTCVDNQKAFNTVFDSHVLNDTISDPLYKVYDSYMYHCVEPLQITYLHGTNGCIGQLVLKHIGLVFNKNKRGKGYCKLNNVLLKEQDYVNMINSEIGRTITTYHICVSKQELLELIKVIVKENSIAYAICRKKKRLCKVSQLEKEIETLDVNNSINNDHKLTLNKTY